VKIAVGCDHGGLELKQLVVDLLTKRDIEVIDTGCHAGESVDYPCYAEKVCKLLSAGDCARGILICGTGIGMSIAANRHRDIRAALCHESFTARMSREHNNANVLCLGARVLGTEVALEIVSVWLVSEFGGGRHQRRLDMLS